MVVVLNKKVQQSWQTSASAMHLPLARLVSMSVLFCLLPSSSIVIFVFYLFSTGISEQHVWELSVSVNIVYYFDASCSVTPMNNSITFKSPIQSLGYIFAATSICVALQPSVQFSPKARTPTHYIPSPKHILTQKWSFKVIQGYLFRCQSKATT